MTDTVLPTALADDRRFQGRIGFTLALAFMAAWLALHVAVIFFYPWETLGYWPVPLIVAALCWLYVAMFIVAHDCMHGTVVPGRPLVNVWIGRICLFLYAGLSFETMRAAHRLHHQHAGTEDDPDFDRREPQGFWSWYLKFFAEYFGFREFAIMFAALAAYMGLGAPYENLLWFWGLPSMLSSLQLFIFGTYLPHSRGHAPFADRHRTRSNDYPWLLSLLTCLHFGYHHEHHSNPGVPWWRLPRLRHERKGGMEVVTGPR